MCFAKMEILELSNQSITILTYFHLLKTNGNRATLHNIFAYIIIILFRTVRQVSIEPVMAKTKGSEIKLN
jgi:hypothetical protein